MILLTISIGFVLGVLTIIGIEILGFLFLVQRLNRKVKDQEIKSVSREVHGDHLDLSYPNKQGPVWVLEVEKIPKNWLTDKGSKEQKRKKEIVEVTPVRKFAKLKEQLLIIKESDGSCIEIRLKDCTIAAVSATNLSSRKWAKRYPIKVESKTSMIYHGSKSLYIYFETSLEKESWCKALRIASSVTNEKLKLFAKSRSEFQNYLTALNTEHPTLMKPTMGFNAEAIDKSIKIDGSSSKVRHFLKKLAKKTSKSGVEYKANWSSTLGRDEKNINEKSRAFQESVSATGFLKPAPIGKATNSLENIVPSTFTHSGSSSNVSVVSDADSDDKKFSDEGTLCLTLLLSRLFFDAKSNLEIKSFVQARIQRSLSNMRIPSYIGEVICTGIHLGNLPPYIHGMRVLPSDMNDILALEIDIEYCGGVVLDIETRIEVCDKDLSEGMSANLESTSGEEVTSELLEGFEYIGNQLKLSEGTAEKTEGKEGNPKLDKTKSFRCSIQGSSYAARWKSIINSVAKQVSQVPLSIGIRVASLRGTLRLQIKAPPSDQLWFGFTSMPDIDLNLESSVGDHKITNGHIALFLINRFKAAIRETMVLPNFESIYIPWMLAEKDDWLPRQVAPFIWVNQEAGGDSTTGHELPSSQTLEAPRTSEASRETHSKPECLENKAMKVECVQPPTKESTLLSLGPTDQLIPNEKPLEELKAPLLGNDEALGPSQWNKEEHMDSQEPTPETQSPSRSVSLMGDENRTIPGDDARPKRMGSARARMLGLGKKMGEKLEERRRNIEEKGRNIVERMREGHKN